MPSNFPPAGTPQRRHRMDYKNEYAKTYYVRRSLIFDRRNGFDMRIVEGLAKLPKGTRTEFVKKAIAEKLGVKP